MHGHEWQCITDVRRPLLTTFEWAPSKFIFANWVKLGLAVDKLLVLTKRYCDAILAHSFQTKTCVKLIFNGWVGKPDRSSIHLMGLDGVEMRLRYLSLVWRYLWNSHLTGEWVTAVSTRRTSGCPYLITDFQTDGHRKSKFSGRYERTPGLSLSGPESSFRPWRLYSFVALSHYFICSHCSLIPSRFFGKSTGSSLNLLRTIFGAIPQLHGKQHAINPTPPAILIPVTLFSLLVGFPILTFLGVSEETVEICP